MLSTVRAGETSVAVPDRTIKDGVDHFRGREINVRNLRHRGGYFWLRKVVHGVVDHFVRVRLSLA